MVAGIFTVYLWDMEPQEVNTSTQYRKKTLKHWKCFSLRLWKILSNQLWIISTNHICAKQNYCMKNTQIKPKSQPKTQPHQFLPPYQRGTNFCSSDSSSLHQAHSSVTDLALSTLSSAPYLPLSPSCPGSLFKAVRPGCLISSSLSWFSPCFSLLVPLLDSLAPIHLTQSNLKPSLLSVKKASVLQALIQITLTLQGVTFLPFQGRGMPQKTLQQREVQSSAQKRGGTCSPEQMVSDLWWLEMNSQSASIFLVPCTVQRFGPDFPRW